MQEGKQISFEEVAAFHGHRCPGLAIGYRMAHAALKALRDVRAQDEEWVAIVENDACGVDAVQYLTGCTFGKGNLIFNDYGKSVYTFYHRASGQAVRIAAKPRPTSEQQTREELMRWLLSAPEGDVVTVQRASMPARSMLGFGDPSHAHSAVNR